MGRWIVMLGLLACAGSAHAEVHAFGIVPGTKIKDVPTLIDGEPGWQVIRLGDVPKPHPWLRAYTANVNNKMEICSVTGSGDISLNAGAKGNQIIKQMIEAYGKPSASRDLENYVFETNDIYATAFIKANNTTTQVRIIFKPISLCREYNSIRNPFQ